MSGGGGSNWNPVQGLQQLSNNAGAGLNSISNNATQGGKALSNNATQGWQGLAGGKGLPWGPLGERSFQLQGPGGTNNTESLAEPWQLGTDIAQNTLNGASQLDPLTHVNINSPGLNKMGFGGQGLAPENYIDKVIQGPTNLANTGMDNAGAGLSSSSNNPYNPATQDPEYNGQVGAAKFAGAQKAQASKAAATLAQQQAQLNSETAANQAAYGGQENLEDALRAAYLQRQGTKANANTATY